MRTASGIILALLTTALLAACHRDDNDSTPSPTVTITHPTSGNRYETPWQDVRLGGTLSHASFVHALNTRTGYRTDGYVHYVDGYGSWFADIPGLQPGDNLIRITADADGTGSHTATTTITVARPAVPAAEIFNGSSAAVATTFWTDRSSFGESHRIALFADGTGRATTGNAYTEPAGAATSFTWVLLGVDAIQINNCPACSFQTISRISGATTEGLFLGETASTGSATDTSAHAFELSTGTL
jgi:hypothetical protein